jgi:hypothetical protein
MTLLLLLKYLNKCKTFLFVSKAFTSGRCSDKVQTDQSTAKKEVSDDRLPVQLFFPALTPESEQTIRVNSVTS